MRNEEQRARAKVKRAKWDVLVGLIRSVPDQKSHLPL
jgi:hypothetical protein